MKSAQSPIDFDVIATAYPACKLRVINFLAPFGLVYVDNPQAASSSIKLLLDRLYSGADWHDPVNVHADRLLPPFRRDAFKAYSASAAPWVFGFVRHPEKRLLQAYSDKMRIGRFRVPINEALGRSDTRAHVSIEDFIAALERSTPDQMNPQWRPQVYNLMMGAIRYDHVGLLDLEPDPFAPLLDRLGLDENALPQRESQTSSDRPDLTPQLRDTIHRVYAEDFAAFGYR